MTNPGRANYHAVLIGINTSDSEDGPGLKGCVPDVQEISKELRKSGIPGSLVMHSFTATPDPESGRLIEPKKQWPTYDNIDSCLSNITRESEQGDHVYIHFSGHSTVVPPAETYSNWDTGDLALVVLDGPCATDESYFHGSELAVHLNNMVNKGIGVTIVLDCCFSGSTLRNSDEVVRYVSYRPELDKRPRRAVKQGHSTVATLRAGRQTSTVPAWLANPDGYAILTSSDATEKAYGVKLGDGSRHGTLTYFLLEVFDGLGGVGGNMHQLAESIRIRITDHRRKHSTRIQSPVLFGNKTQLFFGLSRPSCSADIPITRIADSTGHRVRLHAGAAHGIAKGDEFALHPLSSARDPISTMAEAVTVRGVTSDLQILGDGDKVDGMVSVQTGWLATRITCLLLRQFPLKLLVQQESLAQWKEAIRDRASLAESHADACETLESSTCSFTVVQTGPAVYQIRDEQKNEVITVLSIPEGCDRAIQQILSHIHHLASFKLVLNLSNLANDTDAQQFKQSYSIAMIHEGKGISYNPGCGKTGNVHEVCLHPECQIILTPSDKVRLVVKNLGKPNDPRIFLHLYALGSGWEVEDMTRSSREVIPPAGTILGDADAGKGSKCTGGFRRKLKFSLEEGELACEDVVKVFLTRNPTGTSFATLELPRLGERSSCAGYSEVDFGGATRASPSSYLRDSEDWAALTFRIRVVRDKTG